MNYNYFYNQQLLNDPSDKTGDGVRRKNNLKQKNLMNLSLNFCDMETLEKIKEVFTSLSPEKLLALKNYLEDKEYVKRSNNNNECQKTITKIAQIALTSVPKDEKLIEIKEKFNKNLEIIDKLKVAMGATNDSDEIIQFHYALEELNEKNAGFFKELNNYKEEIFTN